MIFSDAYEAQITSEKMIDGKVGSDYFALQNHDLVNSVCVKFGGNDAVITTPNGMVVKAGEFGELRGKAGDFAGPINVISENLVVDTSYFIN